MSRFWALISSKKFIIILLVVLVFIFFSLKGRNIFISIFKPIGNIFHSLAIKTSSIFSPLADKETYQKENEELRKELNKALSSLGRLYVLEEENKTLRQYLDFKEERYKNLKLTRVIGKREENGSVWFLIDKGEKDGVLKGMPVINEEGILIGEIAKTENKISYFWPVYDSHFKTAGIILQTNNASIDEIYGIVEGQYGLELKMKYIPKEAFFSKGDLVITSGAGNDLEKGLIIGEISEIKNLAGDFFKEATIRPFFEEKDLDIVGILYDEY